MTFDDSSMRVIRSTEEYQAPVQRSDAEKVFDTVTNAVSDNAIKALAHAEEAIEMLSVVDRDGAAKFSGLPIQMRKLIEYVGELRRLRG